MKNVVILKNKDISFYDFEFIKRNFNLRLSLITYEKINDFNSNNFKFIDEIFLLNSPDPKFLKPLHKDEVDNIVSVQKKCFDNTWLVAADELNVTIASSLRDKYKIPGLNYLNSLKYRDKLEQKNCYLNIT